MKEILVYSTQTCPFCDRAKELLASKNLEYKEILIDIDANKRQEMMDKSGRRTVPQIFIDQHHVGGFDDLSALNQSGDLDKLLA